MRSIFDITDWPDLPNSRPASIVELRASDNERHLRLFKQLVRDGVAIHGVLKNDDNYPSLSITAEGLTVSHFVWMYPRFEQFVLNYLLTGNNRGLPKYPQNSVMPDTQADDNYIDRHIKRELERGSFTHEIEERDGVSGVRFKGIYPYGSIDYGFHAGGWEEFTERLEGVEPFVYIGYDERDIPELHNTDLQVEYCDLAEGKHLDSIFSEIPTNTIIDKTVCGCGATTLEINSKRNSIIIEPNVPVIVGKEIKHSNIIGVYGDTIKETDIAKRVKEQTGFVKIMTTPDSYWKVAKALKSLRIPYFTDYFLLFDECEKIVSDIDYRPKLALPIDDFFKFRGKAMVSATPIVINDPRFEEQGFKIVKIRPQFDHRQLLELKPTNNVNAMVRKTLQTIDKDSTVCIFYNSVEGIEDLIAFLKIEEQTNIYCSTDAKKKLRKKDYPNVSDLVTDKDGKTNLNRYNFFTSRFYSAVDIELESKPVILMVTQVYRTIKGQTPHSLIDPETEAVQIVGRFRNGVERVIHITNTNVDMDYFAREDLEQWLKEEYTGFLKLRDLYKKAESEGEKHMIGNAIQNSDYWREGYVTPRGEMNYFRWNNAYMDERMKMLYNFPAPLYKAYNRSGAFNVISEAEYAIYTDKERQDFQNASKAEKIRKLNDILKRDNGSLDTFDYWLVQELKHEYSLWTEALSTIGYARMKSLGFVDSDIRTEVNRFNYTKQATLPKVICAVYALFEENRFYSTREINDNLNEIFRAHKLPMHRLPKGEDITLYFNARERRTGSARGWELSDRLHKDL